MNMFFRGCLDARVDAISSNDKGQEISIRVYGLRKPLIRLYKFRFEFRCSNEVPFNPLRGGPHPLDTFIFQPVIPGIEDFDILFQF